MEHERLQLGELVAKRSKRFTFDTAHAAMLKHGFGRCLGIWFGQLADGTASVLWLRTVESPQIAKMA